MPVLILLFIVAFIFYIFYKIKVFRSKGHSEKQWLSAKASMSLGFFIALFGANQIYIRLSVPGIIVGTVFILLGIINIWGGYKKYKHYLPLLIVKTEQSARQDR